MLTDVTIWDLLDNPVAMKILLALLNVNYAYQFELTKLTGHHSLMLKKGIELLTVGKMIRVIEPKSRHGNTGDFWALTPHGRTIAEALLGINALLKSA